MQPSAARRRIIHAAIAGFGHVVYRGKYMAAFCGHAKVDAALGAAVADARFPRDFARNWIDAPNLTRLLADH